MEKRCPGGRLRAYPQSMEVDLGRKLRNCLHPLTGCKASAGVLKSFLRLAPRLSEWEGLYLVCKQQSKEKRGAAAAILNVKNFNTFAVNTAKK